MGRLGSQGLDPPPVGRAHICKAVEMNNFEETKESRRTGPRRMPPSRPLGGLLRRTFMIALVMISGGLLTSGALELYFRHQESLNAIGLLQQEMAEGAAFRIQLFMRDIEKVMRAATQTRENVHEGMTSKFRFSLLQLMKVSPAITTVTVTDPKGRGLFKESRIDLVHSQENKNYEHLPAFRRAITGSSYFGPVYFVRQSEPFIRMAVPVEWFQGQIEGVMIAEVNLKHIWNVISAIKVGESGLAYVVSSNGELIAHPEISLVLKKLNVKHLTQVRMALEGRSEALSSYPNIQGRSVFSAFAKIPYLDWAVIVEQPTSEAYRPLLNSMLRTGLMLLVGLIVATGATYLVGRRVLRPIEELRQGAERIGSGDLSHRIDIHSGDELEALANDFNNMAGQLQEERAGLEQKVEERTRELAAASRHKSEFLANMSHELRTPLNAILGYTELIQDNIYGELPDKAMEVMGRVQVSGKHLLTLINEVLDLSKIEAGQLTLTLGKYSMKAVVNNVFIAMESLAAAKGLEFNVHFPDDLPIGIGDEQRLTQVLLNLTGNAIKFTDQGSVSIEARPDNGYFHVSITDTGEGIPLEAQGHIFEEFRQVDSSSTKKKGGTGLGLAIAKKFVELHDGSIGVESQPRKGSTFWFEVPIQVGKSKETL